MFKINNQLYDKIWLTIQNMPKNMELANKKDNDDECDGCQAVCNSTLTWHHK